MRRTRIYPRDFRSTVNITPVNSTKDIMRLVANGEPLNLNVTGVTGSYDFDGVDVDFDAPLVEDAPNKIEQQFNKGRYINQALSNQSDQVNIQDTPSASDPVPPASVPPISE